jgi:tRNA dimethylallyltransferase
MKPKLIIIAGPTAIGKTKLAIDLASRYGIEIISADSRQLYRELEIGVAKPTLEELNKVKHHFINHISIHDHYDVGIYENEVIDFLTLHFKTNQSAILCGGTGLYIDAILYGLDSFPDINIEVKEKVVSMYELSGLEKLNEILKEKDIETFHRIDKQNPRRVMRALEVIFQSGKPYSSFTQKNTAKRDFDIIKIGLETDRSILYERINQRVDDMIILGLENEINKLYPHRHLKAMDTVGYREWYPYLEGEIKRSEVIEKIKQHSRNYAKRQMTWFKKDDTYKWFDLKKENQIDLIYNYIDQHL